MTLADRNSVRRKRAIVSGGALAILASISVALGLEPVGAWGWNELALLVIVSCWVTSQAVIWQGS